MTMMFIALAIFFVLYIFISTEIINKTVIALFGASIYLVLKIIGAEEAFQVIDWNVIFLLVSMMIIVGITKTTGLFQYVAIKAAKFAKGEPVKILILLSLICAVFSALLDNVTTVMIIVPVTILIAVELGISPIPFVISIAIASNIGGAATLIGDPPNIMIGSASGLDFMQFVVNLGPAIVICLVFFTIIEILIFRKKLRVSTERKARIMEFDESKTLENIPLLIKCLSVLAIVVAGFLLHGVLHLEASVVAMFGASLLMLITGVKEVDEIFKEIEWGTIFFFVGLFILVGGLVETGAITIAAEYVLNLTKGDIRSTSILIIWISGIFSAFVDNIPYVATMIPLVQDIGNTLGNENITPIWWSLALGSCLGGNGTLVGASANVVTAGLAAKSGYKVSFLEFTKYGFGIMLVTLAISTVYVLVVFL
jgi:Na+/H+ antiporter NhaD/arsenite permease-like protein